MIACRCTPDAIDRYRARVSGPLLDRIDLHLTMARVQPERMPTTLRSESSVVVRKREQMGALASA